MLICYHPNGLCDAMPAPRCSWQASDARERELKVEDHCHSAGAFGRMCASIHPLKRLWLSAALALA